MPARNETSGAGSGGAVGRRPAQDAFRGRRHAAVEGIGGIAIEAEQRLYFATKSDRHLMPRVELLALRCGSIGQLVEESDRVRVHGTSIKGAASEAL